MRTTDSIESVIAAARRRFIDANGARSEVIHEAARAVARARGGSLRSVPSSLAAGLRGVHFESRATERLRDVFDAAGDRFAEPDALGDLYEALRASEHDRKAHGRWFTPRAVVDRVIESVRAARGERAVTDVLDPAMGCGRFLVAAKRAWPAATLRGIDIDPWAVFVARVVLFLEGVPAARLVDALVCADTLTLDANEHVADVVIGNPPWVAYRGRQAVKLEDAVREGYRARYRAFAGFPTLHGMFCEWAANALRDNGVLGFLVPTQVADLDGYGATREAVTRVARVEGVLEELGFDQFAGVVEPTLILRAIRTDGARAAADRWQLKERQDDGADRIPAAARQALESLASLPKFARETFGEAGFQTVGTLSKTHLGPWPPTDPRFDVPLREGSDVHAFHVGPPSRSLFVDPSAFAPVRARYRAESYPRVAVVIRQTARYPIAAVHDPVCGFRNSLLAGYTDDPWTLVALLNSTLLRAFHLASQRDGRQSVFPQLKVAELRYLPSPPRGADVTMLAPLARAATDAQRRKYDATARVRAEAGAVRVPGSVFSRDESERAAAWNALLRSSKVDRVALEPTLLESEAIIADATRAYEAAVAKIDRAVFAAYGVEGAAFAGVLL
jgi:methylase of polypeptide subunit release factors